MADDTCTVCNQTFDPSFLLMSESGPICEACEGAGSVGLWQRLSGSTTLALGAVVGSFVFSFRLTNVIVEGTVNLVHAPLGLVAVLAGLAGVRHGMGEGADSREKLLAGLAVLVGGVQLLRGVLPFVS